MVRIKVSFGWAHSGVPSRQGEGLRYSDALSRLGGVVPRQSHKLQAPVQFGEAQHTTIKIQKSKCKIKICFLICRGSSVGKSAALITLRSRVRFSLPAPKLKFAGVV